MCFRHPIEGVRFEAPLEVVMNTAELLSLIEDGPQVVNRPLNWTLDIASFGYDSCVLWFMDRPPDVAGAGARDVIMMARPAVDDMRRCSDIYRDQ